MKPPEMNTLSDPTLDIDRPYALSDAQLERFRRDGCIKLKQVLSPATLAHYGSAITRLTIDLNTEHRPLHERSTYDRAFLQVMNLWEQSPLVGRFVMGQRLARIAAELLQVSGVRLYHDQSLYKEPGGGITPAHADQYYWPLASDRTITAWIPLQAVPAEMGPLGFYAGSQGVAFGRDLGISDESEAQITENMTRHGFKFDVSPFAHLPLWAMAMIVLVLIGGRIGLNAYSSNVVDVGYAGVVGADRILDGRSPYGSFPKRTSTPYSAFSRCFTTSN